MIYCSILFYFPFVEIRGGKEKTRSNWKGSAPYKTSTRVQVTYRLITYPVDRENIATLIWITNQVVSAEPRKFRSTSLKAKSDAYGPTSRAQQIVHRETETRDNSEWNFEGTYKGATFSCLTKNTTFPIIATFLFRPSERMPTVAFLYEGFTSTIKDVQLYKTLANSFTRRE